MEIKMNVIVSGQGAKQGDPSLNWMKLTALLILNTNIIEGCKR